MVKHLWNFFLEPSFNKWEMLNHLWIKNQQHHQESHIDYTPWKSLVGFSGWQLFINFFQRLLPVLLFWGSSLFPMSQHTIFVLFCFVLPWLPLRISPISCWPSLAYWSPCAPFFLCHIAILQCVPWFECLVCFLPLCFTGLCLCFCSLYFCLNAYFSWFWPICFSKAWMSFVSQISVLFFKIPASSCFLNKPWRFHSPLW